MDTPAKLSVGWLGKSEWNWQSWWVTTYLKFDVIYLHSLLLCIHSNRTRIQKCCWRFQAPHPQYFSLPLFGSVNLWSFLYYKHSTKNIISWIVHIRKFKELINRIIKEINKQKGASCRQTSHSEYSIVSFILPGVKNSLPCARLQ